MTARLPLMGVTLIARNFNTYTRQLQQAQRVTNAASGGMVEAARSAQQHVAAMNAMGAAGEANAKVLRLTEDLLGKQAVAHTLMAKHATENAVLQEKLSETFLDNNRTILKDVIAAQKSRQRAALQTNKAEQASIKQQIAGQRAVAAESKNATRQVVSDHKAQIAATREATAATRQHAAAQAILGAAMLAVGVPLVALTKSYVTAAAEAERFAAAAAITTAARGITPEDLAAERKEMDALFISTARANRTIQQFAIAGLDARKASEFLATALDFSTTSYLSQERVVESLTQAVTSGNVTRLRELGLSTDLGAIHQWYADILDKEVKALTAVEEKQSVLNYIFRIAEGVQGAWAAQLDKTSGLLAQLSFNLGRIREILGAQLLPVVNQVVRGILSLLEAFQRLPAPVQKTIALTTALAGVVLTLGGAYLLLKPALLAVTTALLGLGGARGAASIAAGKRGLGGLLSMVLRLPGPMKILAGIITALAVGIITNFGGLGDLWDRTFGSFIEGAQEAFVASQPWIIGSARLIAEGVVTIFNWMDRQVRGVVDGLAEDNWGFEFDPEAFFVGGAAQMGALAAGLVMGFNQFVLPAVIGIVNAIASFLIGASPPPEGPLADIEKGGIAIIQAWSQGMKSVSLDDLRDLADEVDEILRQAMFQIQDTLFDIQTREFQLDKVLQPFEDALFLARASADLVTIPLEQQRRELEKQIGVLEDIAKIERERAEEYLRVLEKQAEAIQEIVDMDEERLEVIDHEIFIEEQRLKIMGQATSVRLLELKGQKRLTEDSLKDNKRSLSVTENQISAEEERLDALVTAAEAQIKALQTQVDTLNANIELEEERILLAQEALRIEEARQAQARLALLEETRFWEEEQRFASQYLDIIGRIPAETKKRKEAAEAIKKSLGSLFDLLPKLEDVGDKIRDAFDIEEAMRKMREAFLEQFPEGLFAETERLLGELGKSWANLGVVWAQNLEDRFKTFFTETLPTKIAEWLFGPTYDRSFNDAGERLEKRSFAWGQLIQKALWEGFWGAWATDEGGINARMKKMFDDIDDAMQVEVTKLWESIAPGFLQGLRDAMPTAEDINTIVADFRQAISDAFTGGGGGDSGFFTGGPEGKIDAQLNQSFLIPVQDWITQNIPDLETWITAFTTTWLTNVESLLPTKLSETIARALLDWIFEEVDKIKEGESPGGLVDWGQAFLDFPELFVTPTLTDSLELITDILLPWISPDAEQRIITDLITWGNAFIDWVAKDATPFIAEKLDVFMAKINQWMEDTGDPTMYAHGEDLADSLVKGLEDATAASKSRLENIGEEMLEGIKDGLDDEFDDFRRWLRKKLQAIIDAVERELGIKSPSRVFARVGVSMVQGLEEGFGEETDTWISRGMKNDLDNMVEVGQQLVDSIWDGAQEEWPGFETWLLDSVRRLTQDVRFEMSAMTNTVSMTSPLSSGGGTVNNFNSSTTMNISPNYARVQSVASIRDDIGMMMALRR